MECHFSEYRIKKRKEKGETACHLFALIQDRTRGREQRVCVCVCVPQQEPFSRLLLYDPQLPSCVPPLAPPLSRSVNENFANSSPPPTVPLPCFSHHPSLFSGEPGDTSAHSQCLCGGATAAPSRSAPPKWPQARFEPPFFCLKTRHLKTAR